ncbi:DUF805 domain-containing protein [Hymenobacter psychrotolerans]|uniref:Uncharacterized membrane protein YhaH, DUF805 family n=1 Tax=Hymenobacter psychrotolerans DSM 18569 TaxID=1121959 RepID=A0A1M7AXV0_9BACT|nr:DUF805 domain-containing protein [Hymenobacter psychrotolerans]SHL47552.1 Uncharacterized membrane protein YhaH, DUF805 family [Hymenobacter psychrotolerans DSM 18569]
MRQFALFQGRINRVDLVVRLLLCFSPLLPAYYLPAPPHNWLHVLLAGLVLAVCTALAAAVAVRRLHDLYLSGWYALALLVPVINLPAYVLLVLLPGTPAANPWGPVPGTEPRLARTGR